MLRDRLINNPSNFLKKTIVWCLAMLCLLQSIVGSLEYVKGASNYNLLGSNEALGSPILDPSFTAEDWNKWEMLTWGIFLSNFPMPLVDDYDSAFNINSGKGSKGSGLKALQFGSGSDPANKNTITGLLNYAVTQQKSAGLKDIQVAYSPIKRDGIEKTKIDGTQPEGTLRAATFKDLFLLRSADDNDSWVKIEDTKGLVSPSTKIVPIDGDSVYEGWSSNFGKSERYLSIATINEGSLPTFYINYGSGYESIFDYTDGWDAQLLTALIARVACGDFSSEFKDLFNDMWSKADQLPLKMDCFGNIVVEYEGSRRVVIPASANQHLTSSPKINTLNSLLFCGLNGKTSGSELAVSGQQSISGWFGFDTIAGLINTTDIRFGGLPALGSHNTTIPQGLITLYYDLDTVMYDTYFHGGEAANGTKSVTEETNTVYNTHYGKAVRKLFNQDANSSLNDYIFKIEAANMDKFDFGGFSDKKAGEALATMVNASGQIANIAGSSVNAKVLTELITDTDKLKLFSDPVIVPVQMDTGRTKSKLNSAGAGRLYMSYIYDAFKNPKSTVAGELGTDYISTLMALDTSSTMKGFKEAILGTGDGKVNKIMASFVAEKTDLFTLKVDANKIAGADLGNKSNPFSGMKDTKVNGNSVAEIRFDEDGSLDYFPGRLIKAYPTSEVLRSVGNILGVRDGTEFSAYSTYIYMTYLDWYGIGMDKLNGTVKHDFNEHIFDGKEDMLNVDISTLAEIKSEEDKKKEVLNYTYMLLNPTEGKEYRNEIMNSFLNNFFYDNYQKIVYGNATSFYSDTTNSLATRNAAGFLSLNTYSENFTTGWFMKLYTKASIIIIGISFILIIIIGLLKNRKKTWFIVSLIVVINTVLIVPSAGELTPLIANNIVQKMFKSKMTYWAVAESVTNAKLESDYVNNTTLTTGYLSKLSKEEQSKVVNLVKSLNTIYLDRELMVKTDISRKVTQTESGNYAEIQNLRSARWLLPMIMRQFTANDSSADYVYVPLGDMYDDVSNLYWMYNPMDASSSGTVNGQQGTKTDNSAGNDGTKNKGAKVETHITVSDRKKLFPDYIDTTSSSNSNKIEYRCQAYEGKQLDELTHTYFYLLRSDAVPITRRSGFGGEYHNKSSFDDYVEQSLKSGKAKGFLSSATLLEQQAGNYKRSDRSTMNQSYGYLWATESPYPYFYSVVKDSFNTYDTLGAIVGSLQGQYKENSDGVEVRTSFMHSGETGYIKDIVDLQELFTNMVPYLYQMELTAGGTNGSNGVLGDKKIDGYELYKNNNKSWLFRSNWATKIMESPELVKKTTIRDSGNNKVTVKNPTLSTCYPSNRPMIFSEAQMHEEGLEEHQLSLVELKCISVNKEISRRWTLLLNYANIEGMTKEVLLRQMATEAVIAFNTEFSPNGILGSAYNMYPDGIELRAISFDSVMKMLMLNVTKDTSYIYGDTMQNIVENSDVISASLLLISAFLCSYLIPLIRDITMGLIFYLGFLAIIYALLSTTKQKVKVSCGYIISSFIFLGITLLYYGVFSALMAVTTSDSVLTVQSVQVNTGNPVWCFAIIIFVGVVYIIAMLKMIDFCFKHYRDMGMEVYTTVAGMITESLSGGFSGVMDKISGLGNNSSVSVSSSSISSSNSSSSSYRSDSNTNSYREDINSDETEQYRNDNKNEYDSSSYSYLESDYDDSTDALDIDREIEKGKKSLKNSK